jgi:hypothetical protein
VAEEQTTQTETAQTTSAGWTEESMREFMTGIERLNANVEGMRDELRPEPKAPEAPKQAEPPKPLDEMTNAELAAFIRQSTAQEIVDKLQPLLAQFGDKQAAQEQSVLEERYTREIEGLGAKHKDFMDWNAEMIAIVEETPGITPLRAYNLARSENPKKAKDLDDKYAPPKPEPPAKPFSLSPYGSGSGPNAPVKHASKEEAFKAALAKTAAKWPGVLPNLET